MSDADKTVYSSRGASEVAGAPQPSPPPPPDSKKRNPLLIAGGIGCALLLCTALLVGGVVYYLWNNPDNPLAQFVNTGAETETPTVETPVDEPTEISTPAPSPTPEAAEAEIESETATAEPDNGEPSDENGGVVGPEPEFGPITFAEDATDDYEPVGAANTFAEGISEVHAIFDYSGMSPDYTWERVWYLNGDEILRSPQDGKPPERWSGAEEGVFDYFINNGDDPLPAGEWLLELYVEDNLLASASFTIEAAAAPELAAATDDGAEHAADLEATPTARPTSAATAISAATSSSAGGGGTYQLLFTKWNGSQHNLYVADTNGNNERFIFGRAAGPSWTPDGQTIFFFGEEGIDRQVIENIEYVFDGISNGIIAMNAAPLPSSPDKAQLFQALDWKQGRARWANVSPNGQMVAFDADFSGSYRIYFLGTADNQQFRFEILGEQADWSPDSEKIVYRSGRNGTTGIWISNRDDTGHTLITQDGSDSLPAWSPDGQTIAFSRDQGGNIDIYLMNVDGSNVRRITDAPGPDTLPTFTPSGDIIFRSTRSGSWGIWKMSGDGSNQTEIIPNAEVGPDWTFSRMDVR